MRPIDAIRETLDLAWDKFKEVTPENDYEFEEFVVEELKKRGADDVIWYCSVRNCWFVVKFGDKYYDVDYITYKIYEVDKEYYEEKRREVGL